MIALNGKNKGKILFDESSNPVLRAKRARLRLVLLLWTILFTSVLLYFIWVIIFNFPKNNFLILLYLMAVIIALLLILTTIQGYFSITFIKIYEHGISVPEKKFHNTFNGEEFILYSKIMMIKIEQRMLIAKKLIIEGHNRKSSYFGDLNKNVIDIDRFIQVLYKLKDEGKIKFIETEDRPFYLKSIEQKV